MKIRRNIQLIFLPLTLPLSAIYALVVFVRNKLFDARVLKSFTFDIPVICVGNIAVGGTGKTPHIEYLLELLKDTGVAVISRGYKRRSKGFRYVDVADTAADAGDEPLQIKRKYPAVPVAVDIRREQAIRRLTDDYPDLQAILLDDAFQYRRVKSALNIVLVDYGNPIYDDLPLPAGRLRDLCSSLKRADIIIVSKCPKNMTDDEKNAMTARLNHHSACEIYFSAFEYGTLTPVFDVEPCDINDKLTVAIFAGIAKPKIFFDEIASRFIPNIKMVKAYADHYSYTENDAKAFAKAAEAECVLITTEKDAVKLRQFADLFSGNAKRRILYLPVKVVLTGNKQKFSEKIRGIISIKN